MLLEYCSPAPQLISKIHQLPRRNRIVTGAIVVFSGGDLFIDLVQKCPGILKVIERVL
jgi:hypothetical protein